MLIRIVLAMRCVCPRSDDDRGTRNIAVNHIYIYVCIYIYIYTYMHEQHVHIHISIGERRRK